MTYLDQTNETTSFNKSSLLKLYKNSKKTEAQPHFRAKLALKKKHYPELEVFRIHLEDEQNDGHPDFYTESNQKLFRYRLIFLSFSILFLFLTGIVLSFSSNWSYSFLVDSSIKAKTLISIITTSLSMAAMGCAYFPSSLHEATRHVVNKAKRSLQYIYEKQRIQNGIDATFLWGTRYRKSCALRHVYQGLLNKIHEKGEDTYHLLQKITKTTQMSQKAKERLYNQALSELHDKFFFAAQNFKNFEIDSPTKLQINI